MSWPKFLFWSSVLSLPLLLLPRRRPGVVAPGPEEEGVVITKPDGTAWTSTDGTTATTLIVRSSPCGAQRFATYDPINPPVTP